MKNNFIAGKEKSTVFFRHSIEVLVMISFILFSFCVNAQSRKPIMLIRTGTITSSTSSPIVTGTGTLFLSELAPGNSIFKVGTSLGIIASIQSNTQLTLTANATDNTAGDEYSYSEFTATDQMVLSCWIKNFLDNHHWDYVMQHMSPCPLDPECTPGDNREVIHNSTNFLHWHRYFITQLEDQLYLAGLTQFVPLPDWNPNTPIPDAFFNGPCGNANNIQGHPDWDPLAPLVNQDITAILPLLNPSTSGTFWGNLSDPNQSVICNYSSRTSLASAMGPAAGHHGNVHVAVQYPFPTASFHAATGSTWFYIWHAFVDDMWRRWECNCANANPQITFPDIYMKDLETDQITVPVNGAGMLAGLDMGNEPFVTNQPQWNSPDIWVRNQPDGFSTDVHENPVAQFGIPVYVYVRIRNRSCQDYPGGGSLDLHWAKAASALSWPGNWDGTQFCNGGPSMGNIVPSCTLQTIPPIVKGGETIMEFKWYPPNPSDYNTCNPEPWHFCLLARIVDPNDPMFITETPDLGANVLNNNNIVWKNLSVIDMIPWIVHHDDCTKDELAGAVIGVGNPYDNDGTFDLNFKLPGNVGNRSPITDEAEIKIMLDQTTWNKWAEAGFQRQNIEIKNEDCRQIIVTGNPASIKNLTFAAREQGSIYVTFNFLSDKVTATRDFDYHVVQTRGTGADMEVIGGEVYHIIKHDRPAFLANAGSDQSIARGETATLEATDIGEEATYNWYNLATKELISSEQSVDVSPETDTQYELEVISTSDGFKCYDRVNVHIKPYAITSLNPNPATDQLKVSYYVGQVENAQLIVMQAYGYQNTYDISPDQGAYIIDVTSLTPGVYNVILMCDGNMVDMKSAVIE